MFIIHTYSIYILYIFNILIVNIQSEFSAHRTGWLRAWANWVVHLAQKPKLPRRETTENSEADPEKQRSKSLLPIPKPCISDSVGFLKHTILSKMR
jgi:hypothetical protein